MKNSKPKFKNLVLLSVLLCSVFLFFASSARAAEIDLAQLNSEHFIVYFLDDEQFAKDILRRAEFYYKKIAAELSYGRHSKFWTWEDRVKIMVFPDRQAYLTATRTATWSEGMADYEGRKIVSYVWSEGFLDSLLPHEIAHLIFRDFVGFKGEVPLWLDEGVAQWMEPEKRADAMWIMYQIMEDKKALPLDKLMQLDAKMEEDNEKVYIFYVQAASLVGFLIQEHGSKKFAEFCRQLRDGKSLKMALTFAYPTNIRNIMQLEEKWAEYIIKEGRR